MQVKTPIIARGTYTELLEALKDGGKFQNLDRTMFVLLTDDEYKDKFAFVTPDRTLHLVVGHNETQDAAIASLQEAMSGISEEISGVHSSISELQESERQLSSQMSELSETVDEKEAALSERITAVSREVTDMSSSIESVSEYLDDIAAQNRELKTTVEDLSESFLAIQSDFTDISDQVNVLAQSDAAQNTAIANMYTKEEVDAKLEAVTGDMGEGVTVESYVSEAKTEAVSDSKDYTDSVLKLNIV